MPQINETAPTATEVAAPAVAETPKPAAKAKTSPAKKAASPKKVTAKAAAKPKGTHDGATVGYHAKSTEDCRWNKTRVAFYKALRKIGGSGNAQKIAAASKGEISVGNCLNYGYRGVAAGLNNVRQDEGVRGFTFVLTAKGKNADLDKMLAKAGKSGEKDK